MPPFFPSAKTGCLDGDNSENMSRKLSWFVPLRPLPLPFPSFPFPLDLPSFPLPSFPLPDQGSHAMGTKWTSNSSNSSKTPHLCHLYPFHLAIFSEVFQVSQSVKHKMPSHTPHASDWGIDLRQPCWHRFSAPRSRSHWTPGLFSRPERFREYHGLKKIWKWFIANIACGCMYCLVTHCLHSLYQPMQSKTS